MTKYTEWRIQPSISKCPQEIGRSFREYMMQTHTAGTDAPTTKNLRRNDFLDLLNQTIAAQFYTELAKSRSVGKSDILRVRFHLDE